MAGNGTDAACVTVCPQRRAALHQKPREPLTTTSIGCKECVAACPFEIPRWDAATDKVYKCDMCESRITNNLSRPA